MNQRLMTLALALVCAACSGTTNTTTSSSSGGSGIFTGATTGLTGQATTAASNTSGTTGSTGVHLTSTSTAGTQSTSTSTGGTPSTSTSGAATTNSTSSNGATVAAVTNSSSTGGTSNTTTGSGTTSTSSSSSGTTATVCTQVDTVAEVRALAPYTQVCINNLTTVLDSSYGTLKVDGGTQYPGNWYMADSTGEVISMYKSAHEGLLSTNPVRPDVIDVTNSLLEVFPLDAGGTQQIAGLQLSISIVSSSGTLPTPVSAELSDLTATGYNQNMFGHYVSVPSGNYTENWSEPAFSFTSSSGKHYQDGVSISDGTSTVLIDTFTFDFSSGSSACIPADGGQPDLSGGGFNGVFDVEQTDDGHVNGVIFYGSCGK